MTLITQNRAAQLFSQLGNETRLSIVRMLVEAGQAGMKVGEVMQELKIPASTLSHHLLHLKNAGLIQQCRVGTVLVCSVEYEVLESASAFLLEECCSRDRFEKIG